MHTSGHIFEAVYFHLDHRWQTVQAGYSLSTDEIMSWFNPRDVFDQIKPE